MNIRLLASCFVFAALMLPPAVYAADTATKEGASTKESPKEFVSDAVITTKIKAEYAKDKEVSAMNIKVDTDKGVVKLSGNAKSKAEADKAVSIAQATKGVMSVKNEILVSPPSTKN